MNPELIEKGQISRIRKQPGRSKQKYGVIGTMKRDYSTLGNTVDTIRKYLWQKQTSEEEVNKKRIIFTGKTRNGI